HIGSWREPKLREISTKAFIKAVDLCIDKRVDFILIAGDLFNTSLPSVDMLKETVVKLKELKDNNIPVYVIAGSHDYSPSGKTMLDVLESAGLLANVGKGEVVDDKIKLNFTVDKKTGAKITGMLGKRAGLEKTYYENLLRENLEKEDGYKIFLFHSAITEFKPGEMDKIDSRPLSFLPKNFNYYAGGHPHFVFNKEEEGYGMIAYPGPLFPNNFKELEQLSNGGFFIVSDGKVEWEPIQVYNTHHIRIDCKSKTPEQIEKEIMQKVDKKEFINTIITLRLEGVLDSGKPSDIDFKEIFKRLYDKSAYFVMKNTNALTTKEFEEVKVEASSIEDVEGSVMREHLGKVKAELPGKEELVTTELMSMLNKEKGDGEKVADFEGRVNDDAKQVLGLKKVFEG
ncbi:hypothetical protein CMO89_01485, partial [Candidatus Woesearchaeota archaeon]|nr:hypothetical protein [Candidatus Woesearchaeota archaeon]